MSKLIRMNWYWSVLFTLFLFVLWLLKSVLAPFAAAFIIAYIAEPLVAKFTKIMGRNLAAGVVIFGTSSILGLIIFLSVPLFFKQASDLVISIPQLLNTVQQKINHENLQIINEFTASDLNLKNEDIKNYLLGASKWLTTIFGSIAQNTKIFAEFIIFIMLVPIISYYISADFTKILYHINILIPRRYVDTFNQIFSEIDHILASYMRGQLSVCLIQSFYYSILLSMCSVPYAFLIGTLSGFLTLIPYIGSTFGWFLASIASFIAGLALSNQLLIMGIFIFGQLIEGYWLVPYLVGRSVGLHPIWIMLGLAICGYVMGFSGLVLALPITAAIAVPIKMLREKYFTTNYYTTVAKLQKK